MYLVKTPWLLKKLYPLLTWDTGSTDRCIYLTFDDGPIPIVTPFVLNILRQFNARGTFFCIGDNINKHPDIYEQVVADGHRIGNHTHNHLRGWKTDDETYANNFLKCHALVHSQLFRPPYGRIKGSQIKRLREISPDLQIMMWDVLSGDFDESLSPEGCLKNVLKHTESGSIVVFHDSLKAFARLKYTLPRALKYWSEKGYTFEVL